MHDYQHVQYFTDFKIGEQDIAGIVDPGSFECLVRSARCQHCAHPAPPYNHAKSLTYVKNGTVTKHVFGSGPCISMMGYATVMKQSQIQVKWEVKPIDYQQRRFCGHHSVLSQKNGSSRQMHTFDVLD